MSNLEISRHFYIWDWWTYRGKYYLIIQYVDNGDSTTAELHLIEGWLI